MIDKRKILIQLDSDRQPSVFDRVAEWPVMKRSTLRCYCSVILTRLF
jgi:hypothetical protein